MTILAGLAKVLSRNFPEKGKAVLLFQPAEETGEGAAAILHDERFRQLNLNYGFALHNLPKKPSKKVILRNGIFAAASRGMTIRLTGKTSHAAEPENGISPVPALVQLIRFTEKLFEVEHFEDFILVTIIHLLAGKKAFGTSPGDGELAMTLRTFQDQDMNRLVKILEKETESVCKKEGLQFEIEYSEVFPSTITHPLPFSLIKKAAKESRLEINYKNEPFRWSEDFGHFSQVMQTGFFGLGSGINQPDLHNPDFDFPDELIETGVQLFYQVACEILKN